MAVLRLGRIAKGRSVTLPGVSGPFELSEPILNQDRRRLVPLFGRRASPDQRDPIGRTTMAFRLCLSTYSYRPARSPQIDKVIRSPRETAMETSTGWPSLSAFCPQVTSTGWIGGIRSIVVS